MSAYYCVLCDNYFCNDDVICHEYGKKGTELICEDCYLEIEREKELALSTELKERGE